MHGCHLAVQGNITLLMNGKLHASTFRTTCILPTSSYIAGQKKWTANNAR